MDTNFLASSLLFGRVLSTVLMVLVLVKQKELLRLNVYPELQGMRRLLFHLTMVIIIGNLIPMLLDVATLFGFRAGWSIILYAYDNDITIAISSFSIWLLYRMAAKP